MGFISFTIMALLLSILTCRVIGEWVHVPVTVMVVIL